MELDVKDKRLNNLKPFQKGQLSSEEAVKRGSNGGKKSAEVRRTRHLFSNMFNNLLELEVPDEKNGLITTKQKIAVEIVRKAQKGDLDAFKIIRDSIGETPKTEINTTFSGINNTIKTILLGVNNE
jgi:hypothetical protein